MVYFENGKLYRIPTDVRSRSHQVWMGNAIIGQSLAELGVTSAWHFGSFAAGELLISVDKDGRKICFLVDSSDGFELIESGEAVT